MAVGISKILSLSVPEEDSAIDRVHHGRHNVLRQATPFNEVKSSGLV